VKGNARPARKCFVQLLKPTGRPWPEYVAPDFAVAGSVSFHGATPARVTAIHGTIAKDPRLV